MNIAYIRVSTIDQNEERQRKAMDKENIEKYFTEKVSDKDAERPKLIEIVHTTSPGRSVVQVGTVLACIHLCKQEPSPLAHLHLGFNFNRYV